MTKSKRYAMVGAAGFIAPKHMKAIKETGGELVAVYDPSDSVGILDRFFPNCLYYDDPVYLSGLLRAGDADTLVICTPNVTHARYCSQALLYDRSVICEKPLALTPAELDGLKYDEGRSGGVINTIMQLRLSRPIVELRDLIFASPGNFAVDLAYITPRGPWYKTSWKGNKYMSGGMLMNIGIHLFDLLLFLFGPAVVGSTVNIASETPAKTAFGKLFLERASVNWFLSTRFDYDGMKGFFGDGLSEAWGRRFPVRLMRVIGNFPDGATEKLIDFSSSDEDLHVESYRKILAGEGFTIDDVRPSLELVYNLSKYTDKKEGVLWEYFTHTKQP